MNLHGFLFKVIRFHFPSFIGIITLIRLGFHHCNRIKDPLGLFNRPYFENHSHTCSWTSGSGLRRCSQHSFLGIKYYYYKKWVFGLHWMIDVIFYRLGSMRILIRFFFFSFSKELLKKSIQSLLYFSELVSPLYQYRERTRAWASSEISQHPPAHLSRWI